MHVILRTCVYRHVTQLHPAWLSEGEQFYLQRLLLDILALSFSDLCRINRIEHNTFQEVALAAGLFEDQNEVAYTMQEAANALATLRQLRFLFVDLLINDCIPSPMQI